MSNLSTNIQRRDQQLAQDIIGFRSPHVIYGEFLGGIPEYPLVVYREGLDLSLPVSGKVFVTNQIDELGQYPFEVQAFPFHFESNESGEKKIDMGRVKPNCVFDAPLIMQAEIRLPGGSRSVINPAHRFCVIEVQSLAHASDQLKKVYQQRLEEKRYIEVKVERPFRFFNTGNQAESQALLNQSPPPITQQSSALTTLNAELNSVWEQ